MLKKKCPECEAYTYSTNKKMEKCVGCGTDISKIEAIPVGNKKSADNDKANS